MQGPSLFFQIAAGLIPGFLFAGVLLDAIKPPSDWWEKTRWLALWVLSMLVFGEFALFAEIAAIRGALGEDLDETSIWAVILAVVGGTTLLALRFLWPWFEDLPWTRRSIQGASVVLAVLFLSFVVTSARLLRTTVELAESSAERQAAEKSLADFERQTHGSNLGVGWPDTLRLLDAEDAKASAAEAVRLSPSPYNRERLRRARLRVRIVFQHMVRSLKTQDRSFDESLQDLKRSIDRPAQ